MTFDDVQRVQRAVPDDIRDIRKCARVSAMLGRPDFSVHIRGEFGETIIFTSVIAFFDWFLDQE